MRGQVTVNNPLSNDGDDNLINLRDTEPLIVRSGVIETYGSVDGYIRLFCIVLKISHTADAPAGETVVRGSS